MRKETKVPIVVALIFLAAMLAGCASEQAELVTAGDSQMAAGNYRAAAARYQEAQECEASDKVHLRLATALQKAGSYNEALAELDKASKGLPKADYIRAVCYLGLNDVANAQKSLEQALQGRPDDSLALALLGRLKLLQKQYAQSIEAYRTALATSSDEAVRTRLYYNLAMAQLLTGQFSQEKQQILDAIADESKTYGDLAVAK
jgi:tetratricopeptide (TPR) repeat protein